MKQGSCCRSKERTLFCFILRLFILHPGGIDVLRQNVQKGLERPNTFMAKRISGPLRNLLACHATECELLSLIIWLKLFRPYLAGLLLKLLIDHCSLVNLYTFDCRTGKYSRWLNR